MVHIRIAKSICAFRNKITNGSDSFAPAIQNCKRISHAAQLLLYLANNAARAHIHNNYLCQECGGYRQG